MAPMIFDPSANLCVPAVLVALGVYDVVSLIDSWSENRINISSLDEDVPIVVSVPKNIKCLSGVDTKLKDDDVGALASIVALVSVAPVGSESHSNVSQPFIVAISLLPKLSNDHSPGAVTISPDVAPFHAK